MPPDYKIFFIVILLNSFLNWYVFLRVFITIFFMDICIIKNKSFRQVIELRNVTKAKNDKLI